jgi:hypothetical protein
VVWFGKLANVSELCAAAVRVGSSRHALGEIGAPESPFERLSDSFPAVLKLHEPPVRFSEVMIRWRQHRALNDGEEALDLVEPGVVHWEVGEPNGAVAALDSEEDATRRVGSRECNCGATT